MGVVEILAVLIVFGMFGAVVMIWRKIRRRRANSAFVVTPRQRPSRGGDDNLFLAWLAFKGFEHGDLPPSKMAELRRQFNASRGS